MPLPLLPLAWLVLVLGACDQAESPASSAQPTTSAATAQATSTALVQHHGAPLASTRQSSAPTAIAGSQPVVADVQPALFDPQGKPLPQTEQRPNAASPSFNARMLALVAALRSGDPKLAHPAFFPLSAYEQVKAIANPRRDYDTRLLAAFDRDILAVHEKLGSAVASLRFEGVEVAETKVQWMARGKEGNRIGYYRVKRSRLKLAAEQPLDPIPILSMISWRGEWYVVHLSSFK